MKRMPILLPAVLLAITWAAMVAILLFLMSQPCAAQQTNRPVMVSTNTGELVGFSTNLFEANSNWINRAIGGPAQGSGFTNLNASQLLSGTVAHARLPSTVVSNSQLDVFFYTLVVSNLSGTIVRATNGYWTNGVFDRAFLASPTMTNGVNWGAAFSSPGAASGSEQLGSSANASGDDSLAVGQVATSGGQSSMAVGPGASSGGAFSAAVGSGADSTGIRSFAAGNGALAVASNSAAIGRSASVEVTGPNGLALGNFTSVTHTNATAIGNGAASTTNNQVMIGAAGISTFVQNDLTVQTNLAVGGTSSLAGAVTLGSTVTNVQALGPATFNSSVTATSIVVVASASVAGDLTVGGGFYAAGRTTNLTAAGTFNFPVNSDVAFARYPVTTLANGNNSAIPVLTNTFIQVSGPSAAFTNCGFANPRDGKLIYVLNLTGQDMVFSHENGNEATAGNRILTLTGGDKATTGNGAGVLIYNSNISRWVLLSIEP